MDSLTITILDIIDITLVAILLYYVYNLLKGTVAINIFIGIIIIVLIWELTRALKMEMLSKILGTLISAGAIGLIVLFQQELRKFLVILGSTNISSKHNFMKQIRFLKTEISTEVNFHEIIRACESLAASKTGALIVVERNNSLDFLKESGDSMHAEVNTPLLESIFFKNSPLHDGATIIKNKYIKATRVILPLSDNTKIPNRYGLRHRAAIGITERTDAFCLVVSEETGKISYIKDGEFVKYKSIEDLIDKMRKYM